MNDNSEEVIPTQEAANVPVASDGLLAYERLQDPEAISNAIYTREGESVVIRNAFRWKKDGVVIPNAYESFSLEGICEERGWNIVERYGDHIAIISG